MRFDLKRMALRKKRRTRDVTLRPIIPTKAQANDLAAVLLRMLRPWTASVDRILVAYDRELARVLQHDSPEELGGMPDEVATEVNRLILELTPDLRRWALRREKWHRGKWVRAILAGLEVDAEMLIGPTDMEETIRAFLVRNTSLIRDVNQQTRGKIADAVLRGIQQRTPTAKVAKEVREATGFARARARRIAADQSVKLSSALDRERQRQAGIDEVKWRHSGKVHARPHHEARDGKLYELDTGRQVDGADVIEPGDRPGEPPFCACLFQAHISFDD